jgi:hypothetical protein
VLDDLTDGFRWPPQIILEWVGELLSCSN